MAAPTPPRISTSLTDTTWRRERQWSDKAIARTTPCLLALFSIVTLLAARLPARLRQRIAAAAWYPKPRPTFADALAAVRYAIWRERTLATSPRRCARTKPRFRLPAPWAYALCHAAGMAKIKLRGPATLARGGRSWIYAWGRAFNLPSHPARNQTAL